MARLFMNRSLGVTYCDNYGHIVIIDKTRQDKTRQRKLTDVGMASMSVYSYAFISVHISKI